MAVRMRPLRLSDYGAMIQLFDVCGLSPRVHGRDSRPAFAYQLRSNRALYLGAFDTDRLVGTVLGTHDTRKAWVNRLAVHPDYRRRGLAARLVRACEKELRKRGFRIFAALVDGDNVASQELFTRLGYASSDIRYYRKKLREDI
ncbi:MAG TPA: GNAT family N-acetyltransferase [Thermoplasmata archaeon]|nr:GNAT family N-acetyltransferase [Thermoplasmata archaeon]